MHIYHCYSSCVYLHGYCSFLFDFFFSPFFLIQFSLHSHMIFSFLLLSIFSWILQHALQIYTDHQNFRAYSKSRSQTHQTHIQIHINNQTQIAKEHRESVCLGGVAVKKKKEKKKRKMIVGGNKLSHRYWAVSQRPNEK